MIQFSEIQDSIIFYIKNSYSFNEKVMVKNVHFKMFNLLLLNKKINQYDYNFYMNLTNQQIDSLYSRFGEIVKSNSGCSACPRSIIFNKAEIWQE